MEGDDRGEAYTAIVRGGQLSREREQVAEAETVRNVEGNMCGAVMRGADALPRPETPSRTAGTWEISRSAVPPVAAPVRGGKARSRSRRCTGVRSQTPS